MLSQPVAYFVVCCLHLDLKGVSRVSGRKRTCKDNPSGQLLLGVRQFNNHDWFECHETIEALWMHEQGELRSCFQGLIQLAIAQLHWRNGNFNGAVALLEGGIDYLRQAPSPCQWLDLVDLIRQAELLLTELKQLGPDEMGHLDQGLLLTITTASD